MLEMEVRGYYSRDLNTSKQARVSDEKAWALQAMPYNNTYKPMAKRKRRSALELGQSPAPPPRVLGLEDCNMKGFDRPGEEMYGQMPGQGRGSGPRARDALGPRTCPNR